MFRTTEHINGLKDTYSIAVYAGRRIVGFTRDIVSFASTSKEVLSFSWSKTPFEIVPSLPCRCLSSMVLHVTDSRCLHETPKQLTRYFNIEEPTALGHDGSLIPFR